MNYELAKELKDAGFPFREGYSFDDCGDYQVSLSELIEACGDIKFRLQVVGKTWIADEKNTAFEEYGATPEEAVARLWLALHALEAKAPA